MTVELKNDLQVKGVLISVDQYLNIKLDNVSVTLHPVGVCRDAELLAQGHCLLTVGE